MTFEADLPESFVVETKVVLRRDLARVMETSLLAGRAKLQS